MLLVGSLDGRRAMQAVEAGGGGGGASAFAVDVAEVRLTGAALKTCATTVSTARQVGPVQGLGEAQELGAALESFRTTWDESLRQWGDNLTRFGGAVTRIGSLIDTEEAGRAQAFRPVGGQLP